MWERGKPSALTALGEREPQLERRLLTLRAKLAGKIGAVVT